jgi:hypothetical protein
MLEMFGQSFEQIVFSYNYLQTLCEIYCNLLLPNYFMSNPYCTPIISGSFRWFFYFVLLMITSLSVLEMLLFELSTGLVFMTSYSAVYIYIYIYICMNCLCSTLLFSSCNCLLPKLMK